VRKSKRKSKNQARRGERDFDQTAFTLFQKATGIKQSKTRRSAQTRFSLRSRKIKHSDVRELLARTTIDLNVLKNLGKRIKRWINAPTKV
jgi:hypothetical protein